MQDVYKMLPGRHLEDLVWVLERVAHCHKEVSVIKNAKLRDRRTGRKREHDVLVKIHSGSHEVLIALECRDRSRYTDVPQIDHFKTKCDATGIGNRVIVATAGFSHSAIAAAQAEGIGCWTLDRISDPDWNINSSIMSHQNIVEHVNFKFLIDKLDQPFILTNLNGEHLSRDSWIRMAQLQFEEWQKHEQNLLTDSSTTVKLLLDSSHIQARFDDGTTSTIRDLVAEVRYRTDGQMVPGDVVRITDAIGAKVLVEAAVYRVNADGFDGHVVVKRTGHDTSMLQVLSDRPVKRAMEFHVILAKSDQRKSCDACASAQDESENAIVLLQKLLATT